MQNNRYIHCFLRIIAFIMFDAISYDLLQLYQIKCYTTNYIIKQQYVTEEAYQCGGGGRVEQVGRHGCSSRELQQALLLVHRYYRGCDLRA